MSGGATVACLLTGRARALWSTGRSWMGKGVFALLDQGLISGSNFIVAILLARRLMPRQYGGYALAFEVFLGLAVVYGALMLEPMSVLGSSVYRGCLREYVGVLLRIHLGISIVAVVILGGSALAAHQLARSGTLPSALAGVTLAAPCILLFWLVRRAFYIRLESRSAALSAVLYCAVLLVGLLVAYRRLSPFNVFLLMALGAIVVSPLLLIMLRPSMGTPGGYPSLREVVASHWTYGRWALASAGAIWASGAVLYPVLGAYKGLAATGAFKGLMNFYSPIGQVFVALSLLSLPYASRISHQSGAAQVKNLTWKLTWIYAGGTAAYWAMIIPLRGTILHVLYADKYSEVASLIPWLALGSVLRIASTAQAITLRALQSPFLVFIAYASCSAVAALMSFPAISAFGLRGAVLTLVVSSGVAFGVVQILLRRALAEGSQLPTILRQAWSSTPVEAGSPGMRARHPGNTLNGLRQDIAATLNTSSNSIVIDHWRYSGESRAVLHCRGTWRDGRFFAKQFLANPYPCVLRVELPSGDGPTGQFRAVQAQMENEWEMTNELRALGGASFVPAPLARSSEVRTLVWAEAAGVPLDRVVQESRWADPKGKSLAAALLQAGAWLRKVHDRSCRDKEILEIGVVIERIRELALQGGVDARRYVSTAISLLEAARRDMGNDKLEAPVVLNHGDFAPCNLLWDKQRKQLAICDFEHCGWRNACHDLMAMIFHLRCQLLNPLIPKSVLDNAEASFWAGYGSTPAEMLIFIKAVASARIFYYSLPRLSTRRRRRGWIAGANAAIYKALFEGFIITHRLGIAVAPDASGGIAAAAFPLTKKSSASLKTERSFTSQD